jgi:FixJ family two-component response regulator
MASAELRTKLGMFSTREREILASVARGMDNEQIAEDLDLTLEEVLWYQAELLGKMDFQDIPLAIKSILKQKTIATC